jgi:hypothetical protein
MRTSRDASIILAIHVTIGTVFSVVRTAAVVMQQCGKHISAGNNPNAIETLFFYAVRAEIYNQDGLGQLVCCKSAQLIVRLWKEDYDVGVKWPRISCKSAQLKVRIYVWYLERDCYSSCVKIRCQETISGDCNRLRTLVCVCQWSVKCSQRVVSV